MTSIFFALHMTQYSPYGLQSWRRRRQGSKIYEGAIGWTIEHSYTDYSHLQRPAAVESPQIIEGGTPAATLASDDAASIQDSLLGLQTVSNSASNVTLSVDAEGVDPWDLIAKAGAAQAMLVSSIKHATSSRAGGSPPGDVEVEATDVPPSIIPEASLTPMNDVETTVADTLVSAVRITDKRTPPDLVVGTEPGTTPTPSLTHGLRTEFYKVKVLNCAPLNVPVQVVSEPAAQHPAKLNPLPLADSGANVHFLHKVPPHINCSRGVPASLSSVGRGSVSVLPNAGRLPTQWGVSNAATAAAAASGLPSVTEESLDLSTPDAVGQSARDASQVLHAAGLGAVVAPSSKVDHAKGGRSPRNPASLLKEQIRLEETEAEMLACQEAMEGMYCMVL
ncbi:hypothetical protein DFH08DRAFT_817267 [Mycena albidolilacea]|uniref:Uncharacterized protein n=1 Tax=Mycena albidolilacea TaxID=1033008 RepID=A0AAD7EHZ6_9AGAR|nr:hypothetical protein DFH08DRAFT_817267 [Mycena albidolilacea]